MSLYKTQSYIAFCIHCLPKNVYNDTLGSFKKVILWSKADVRKYSIKKLFSKYRKIHRKTHALQPLFNMQNSLENTSAAAYFSDRVKDLQSTILSKKRLQHMCLPVNFAKFIRTTFLRTPTCNFFFLMNKVSHTLLIVAPLFAIRYTTRCHS